MILFGLGALLAAVLLVVGFLLLVEEAEHFLAVEVARLFPVELAQLEEQVGLLRVAVFDLRDDLLRRLDLLVALLVGGGLALDIFELGRLAAVELGGAFSFLGLLRGSGLRCGSRLRVNLAGRRPLRIWLLLGLGCGGAGGQTSGDSEDRHEANCELHLCSCGAKNARNLHHGSN